MKQSFFDGAGFQWLADNSESTPQEIEKQSSQTRAWFARINQRSVFVKWYPETLRDSWAEIETAIAGSLKHPAAVPLWERVGCSDGTLLVYPRVRGENLGPQEVRLRFQRLPAPERVAAVLAVAEVLSAVCALGFMVVDWYEGNMIYDFEARRIHLFDWELCRRGGSFVLEMECNYGSSRLMAPEEFVRGSRLDQSTLVFNLGRYTLLTLPEFAEPLAPLTAKATYPTKRGRHATVREFVAALHEAVVAI